MTNNVRASAIATPVRVPKAAELVAAQLRGQIVRGELAEGDALPPEHELMRRFGVSRPTLREAFRVLEGEALLSVQRGARGGARIHTPDGDAAAKYAGLALQFRGATVADVYDARRALEIASLRMILEHVKRSDLVALEENVAAMEAATDPQEIIWLHDRFHRLLVQIGGNQTLTIFEEMIHHIIELHGQYEVAQHSELEVRANAIGGARTHARLLELLAADDPDAALELWIHHLDEYTRMVLHGDDATTVLELLT
jgi:GntR family transcriptional repressor for pyruvate dehydrogenase complex